METVLGYHAKNGVWIPLFLVAFAIRIGCVLQAYPRFTGYVECEAPFARVYQSAPIASSDKDSRVTRGRLQGEGSDWRKCGPSCLDDKDTELGGNQALRAGQAPSKIVDLVYPNLPKSQQSKRIRLRYFPGIQASSVPRITCTGSRVM